MENNNFYHCWFESLPLNPLNQEEFTKLPEEVRQFLEQNRLLKPLVFKHYDCFECYEQCILPVEYEDNKPYFSCPTGFLRGLQWIDKRYINGFQVDFDRLLMLLKNSVSATIYEDASCSPWHTFGLIPQRNMVLAYGNIAKELLVSSASLAKRHFNASELFLLLPQPTRNKSIESTLLAEGIYVSSLKDIFDSRTLMLTIPSPLNKETDTELKTLVLKSPNIVIYKGHSFTLSPLPFKLLCFLAHKASEWCGYDEIAVHLWHIENEPSLIKQLDQHKRSVLKTFSKLHGKKGIRPDFEKHLITTINKGFSLNLKAQDIDIENFLLEPYL